MKPLAPVTRIVEPGSRTGLALANMIVKSCLLRFSELFETRLTTEKITTFLTIYIIVIACID